MDYRTGNIRRVFSIRFDEGEDFLSGLTEIITKEEIQNGWFHILGGIREIDIVTGPREPVMPPEPVWREMRDARETIGSGSVYRDENNEPKIHLHAALGHHGDTVTGCLRKGSRVYLVLEVFLMEISGFDASRPWYETGGFNRLTFK